MTFERYGLFHRLQIVRCFIDCSKTRGMGAGRKLKNHRRAQLWADKSYKKSHLGNEWKKPFAGSSHAKGIVLEKMCVFFLFVIPFLSVVESS